LRYYPVDGMEETLELVLQPPLPFEPSGLVVNRNGLFAALLGDDGSLALLQLPQATCPPADGATPCTHMPLAAELTADTAIVQARRPHACPPAAPAASRTRTNHERAVEEVPCLK
jgi:hypothetical protein